MDFQVSYLRQILGLIGLTDITFVHADRQGMGGQDRPTGHRKGDRQVSSVVESFATKLVA